MQLSTIELAMLNKAGYRGVNTDANVLRQKMQKLKKTNRADRQFIQEVYPVLEGILKRCVGLQLVQLSKAVQLSRLVQLSKLV